MLLSLVADARSRPPRSRGEPIELVGWSGTGHSYPPASGSLAAGSSNCHYRPAYRSRAARGKKCRKRGRDRGKGNRWANAAASLRKSRRQGAWRLSGTPPRGCGGPRREAGPPPGHAPLLRAGDRHRPVGPSPPARQNRAANGSSRSAPVRPATRQNRADGVSSRPRRASSPRDIRRPGVPNADRRIDGWPRLAGRKVRRRKSSGPEMARQTERHRCDRPETTWHRTACRRCQRPAEFRPGWQTADPVRAAAGGVRSDGPRDECANRSRCPRSDARRARGKVGNLAERRSQIGIPKTDIVGRVFQGGEHAAADRFGLA